MNTKLFPVCLILTALIGTGLIIISSCLKEETIDLQKRDKPIYTDGQGEIGKIGGIIRINDDSSPINGAFVEIPENSLPKNTFIKVSAAPDSISFPGENSSPIIQFEPKGLKFESPITIGIPFNSNVTDTSYLNIFYYDKDSSIITQIPKKRIDLENNIIFGETMHFSYYTVWDGRAKLDIEMLNIDSKIGVRLKLKDLHKIPTKLSHALETGMFSVWEEINNMGANKSVFVVRLYRHRSLSPLDSYIKNKKIYVNRVTYGFGADAHVYVGPEHGTLVYSTGAYISRRDHESELAMWNSGEPLIFYFDDFEPEDNHNYYVKVDWFYSEMAWENFIARVTKLYQFNNQEVRKKISEMTPFQYGQLHSSLAIDKSYITREGPRPTVTTSDVTNISPTSAKGGGNVTSQGSTPVTAHGLVWNTEGDPSLDNHQGANVIGIGLGQFTGDITNLTPKTTYYVAAYATNSAGTAYGSQVQFATLSGTGQAPTVSTSNITNITQTSASGGGNVTDQGSSAVKARGVVWGTMPNPTITYNEGITTDGAGTGNFNSTITGLTANTTYYIRAYALNSHGTGHGQILSFTTLSMPGDPPAVPTNVYAGDWAQGFGVYWNDNSTNETGFHIYKATNSLVNLQEYGTAPSSSTFFADNQNNPDNFYAYQVTAFNNDGESEMSTMAVVPKRPINLAGQAGANKIKISWEYPVNSQAERVYVHRSTTPDGTFTPIGYVSYPTTSIEHTDAETGINYYYKAYSTYLSGANYSCVSLPTDVVGPFFIVDVQGGWITDPRDSRTYKTVTIGNQTWMAENLAYLPSVVGPGTGSQTTPYHYVYGYNGTSVSAAKATANYQTYGVLYNWPAALSACPAGWHLPTDAEWTTLQNYLIANGYNYDGTTTGNKIAKSLAMASGWASYTGVGTVGNTDFPEKRNATGFSALPGGFRLEDGSFDSSGNYGYWWSAAEDSSADAWNRSLGYYYSDLGRGNSNKEGGFSVRCLRD